MTLTTVGYGDLSPSTFPGKLIGNFYLILLAYFLVKWQFEVFDVIDHPSQSKSYGKSRKRAKVRLAISKDRYRHQISKEFNTKLLLLFFF